MAVTPLSLSTLSSEEQATLTRVEAAVDAELRLKFVSGEAMAIRSVLLRPILELNAAVLTELKSRYVAVGWDIVEYESAEGTWLSLSET
jgi:hypothetical protein